MLIEMRSMHSRPRKLLVDALFVEKPIEDLWTNSFAFSLGLWEGNHQTAKEQNRPGHDLSGSYTRGGQGAARQGFVHK